MLWAYHRVHRGHREFTQVLPPVCEYMWLHLNTLFTQFISKENPEFRRQNPEYE
jgi:hypothetical protein